MKEQQGQARAEATHPNFWNRDFWLGSLPPLPTEHHASVVHAHVGILGEKTHECHGISKARKLSVIVGPHLVIATDTSPTRWA